MTIINYKKLWYILIDRGMTKESLKNKAGLSSATMTKISKGESVTLKTINAICNVLQVQPGDILEWEPDKQLKNKENL